MSAHVGGEFHLLCCVDESIHVQMWTLEALMLASFVGFSGLNLQCSYIGDCRLSLAKCGCILSLKEVDVLT